MASYLGTTQHCSEIIQKFNSFFFYQPSPSDNENRSLSLLLQFVRMWSSLSLEMMFTDSKLDYMTRIPKLN